MATRIDGKALAAKVKAQAAEAAKGLSRQPGLAVILVGNDPASRVYVNGKEQDCAECGFASFEHALPEETHPGGAAGPDRAAESGSRGWTAFCASCPCRPIWTRTRC